MKNVFDQFDAAASVSDVSNPFDQFDSVENVAPVNKQDAIDLHEQSGGGLLSSLERGVRRLGQSVTSGITEPFEQMVESSVDALGLGDSVVGETIGKRKDETQALFKSEQERINALPVHPAMRDAYDAANNADGLWDATKAFVSEINDSPDTFGVLTEQVAELAPQMLTIIFGAKGMDKVLPAAIQGMTRSTAIMGGAGFASSVANTYGSNVADALEKGMEFEQAQARAALQSAAQGGVDALTTAIVPWKIGPNQFTNIPAQTMIQMVGGATGEIARNKVVGEEASQGDIVAEGLLEALGLPGDIVAAIASRKKPVVDQGKPEQVIDKPVSDSGDVPNPFDQFDEGEANAPVTPPASTTTPATNINRDVALDSATIDADLIQKGNEALKDIPTGRFNPETGEISMPEDHVGGNWVKDPIAGEMVAPSEAHKLGLKPGVENVLYEPQLEQDEYHPDMDQVGSQMYDLAADLEEIEPGLAMAVLERAELSGVADTDVITELEGMINERTPFAEKHSAAALKPEETKRPAIPQAQPATEQPAATKPEQQGLIQSVIDNNTPHASVAEPQEPAAHHEGLLTPESLPVAETAQRPTPSQSDESAFIPTHETSDGTQVRAYEDEPGAWEDAEGNIIEDDYAAPISNKVQQRQTSDSGEKPAPVKAVQTDTQAEPVADPVKDEANQPNSVHAEATPALGAGTEVQAGTESQDQGFKIRHHGKKSVVVEVADQTAVDEVRAKLVKAGIKLKGVHHKKAGTLQFGRDKESDIRKALMSETSAETDTYPLGKTFKEISSKWRPVVNEKTEPDVAQQRLIDAVKKARESGAKSYREGVEHVKSQLGSYIPENIDIGVDGGAIHSEVVDAWHYLDKKNFKKAKLEAAKKLDLSVGDKIGRFTPNTGKMLKGGVVESINDAGDYVVLAVAGNRRVRITLDAVGLEAAIDRANPAPTTNSAEAGSKLVDKAILPRKEQMGAASKNIARLLHDLGLQSKALGGEYFHVRIPNEPYMDLVIERLPGDKGKDQLYFTHYYDQNGDRVMDGEMVYAISPQGRLNLVETAVQNPEQGGELRNRDVSFANMFSRNLLDQGFGEVKLGDNNASVTSTSVESDRETARDEGSTLETAVQPETGKDGSGAGTGRKASGQRRSEGQSDNSVSDTGTSAAGKSSSASVREQEPGSDSSAARDSDARRGRADSAEGQSSPESGRDGESSRAAGDARLAFEEKQKVQTKAESIKDTRLSDIQNIRDTLPILLPEQQDDVLFAEERFNQPDAHGVLFTNGTGTGKTFTGLGVAKRFHRQGKTNILIVAPTDKVARDWVASGKHFNLPIKQLNGITDNGGEGAVVTMYANLGQNKVLVERDWDLIIPDEAHKLSQSQAGRTTDALQMMRALSQHPSGIYTKAYTVHGEELEKAKAAYDKAEKKLPVVKPGMPHDEQVQIRRKHQEFEKESRQAKRVSRIHAKIDKYRKKLAEQPRTAKVTFLSATPFAYHKNMQYADGYLFDSGQFEDKERQGGYNVAQGFDSFLQTHLGYHMRTGSLNAPEAEVDVQLAERNLNKWLKEQKVLRGRRLEVDQDYSREFVLAEDGIGAKIDEGLKWVWDNHKQYPDLTGLINKHFDYLKRLQFLEAVKSRESIDRIQQHLDLGRKVVLFHGYKKSDVTHPFRPQGSTPKEKAVVESFKQARPDLWNLDLTGLASPIDTITSAFPETVLFNGDVSKGERARNVKAFNEDDSGVDVILIQRDAGKEGISLHDMSNKHQRVLIDLGLPTKPTDAIQTEGRIYRTGVVSDAIFEYFTTGQEYEKRTFAEAVARRSSTAENLALGHEARNLLQAFVDAYTESGSESPGKHQGTGGREKDRALFSETTEFDQAKPAYYTRQKNSKSRQNREGKDYYATPEPLGLKMVEWANLKPNESALEPSAGHGAIARWFPDYAKSTFVEPSYNLVGELGMLGKGEVKDHDFESLHIVNKYDAVIMNPPFGQGGSTAVKHLDKAFNHLRNGGRVVALIPRGGSADKKFDAWYESQDEAVMVADIGMPSVTFKRAGTSVNTRVVIIDRMDSELLEASPHHGSRQFDIAADSTKELFEKLEDMSPMPERAVSGEDVEITANYALKGAEKLTHPDMVVTKGTVQAVRKAISGKVLQWGQNAPEVEVVQSVDDLPAHLQPEDHNEPVFGVHDPASNAVYLVADYLGESTDVQTILAHEAVGHYAMEEMLGDKLMGDMTKRVQWMKDHGDKVVLELADEVARDYGDIDSITESKEIIAKLAERRALKSKLSKLWTDIVAKLRKFLRKIGLPMLFKSSDLEAVLGDAERWLRKDTGKRTQRNEALWHRKLGEIDLVMGEGGAYGASRFVAAHPEIGANIGMLVAESELIEETSTRATLRNDDVTFDLVKRDGRWRLTEAERGPNYAKGRSTSRRTEWGDFPAAIFQAPLNTAKKHADYAAAKSGDLEAAYRVAKAVVGDKKVDKIREALAGSKPVIVPVFAEEARGRNMLPVAYARVLADRLGLEVSMDIVQSNRAKHTDAGAFHRIAVQPSFDGDVQQGHDYLIVDDTIAMGGTIASLRGHIESNGGNVVLASALTGFDLAAKMSINDKMLNKLRDKHGDELEQYFQKEFGFGLEGLTQGEAGHLAKAPSVDEIRNRISEARRQAGLGKAQPDELNEAPPTEGFSDSRGKKPPNYAVRKKDTKPVPKKAIEFLRRNPGLAKQFEKRYGVSAAEYLTDKKTSKKDTTANPNTEKGAKQIPQKAIDMLHENPSLAGMFEEKYGVSAAEYLAYAKPRNEKEAIGAIEDLAKSNNRFFNSLTWAKLTTIPRKLRVPMLNWMTGDQIVEAYHKPWDSVKGGNPMTAYNDHLHKMKAVVENWLHDASRRDQQWAKLSNDEAREVDVVIMDATLHQIHPDQELDGSLEGWARKKIAKLQRQIKSRPGEDNAKKFEEIAQFKRKIRQERDRVNAYEGLIAKWNKLSKDQKDLYYAVKGDYEKQWDLLLKSLQKRIAETASTPEQAAAGRESVSKVREQLHRELKRGPYFPMVRHGDFVIIAKNDQGDYVREHAENEAQALEVKQLLVKEGFKGSEVRWFKLQDTPIEEMEAAPGMAQEIYKLVDKHIQKNETLKDEINQYVLKMMPGMSFAKRGIHRNRVLGFSKDTRRAYAYTMFHGANHISKVQYGHKMQQELDRMSDEVSNYEQGKSSVLTQDEAFAMSDVTNHMRKRHERIMNPTGHPITAWLGNFGFIMYLGFSPAAGVVNLTQTALVAYPKLGARYGWYRAARELMLAMKDYANSPKKLGLEESWVSLSRNDKIPAAEKKFILDKINDGTIDVTQSHSIAALADTDVRSRSSAAEMHTWKRRTMMGISSFFHNAETLNREVTALAAFRLSGNAEKARMLTLESHFNYASWNMAEAMKNNFVKVATMLKRFSQHMVYNLVRNAWLSRASWMGNKNDAETIHIARNEFTGMMVMHALFAGSLGLPLIDFVFKALDAALGDDDEPFDSKAAWRTYVAQNLGPDWEVVINKGAANAITGMEWQSRVAINELIWREPNRELEGRDAAHHIMEQLFGPMGGTATSWLGAMSDFNDGEFQRGVEKMAPKFLRDYSRMFRYNDDGVLTYQDDPVIEDTTLFEEAMQGVGFSPSRLNDRYDLRNAIKNKEGAINDRIKHLKNKYYLALKSGDRDDLAAADAAIQRFRKKNPRHAGSLNRLRLNKSIRGRRKADVQTDKGIYTNKRMRYLMDEIDFGK